MASTDKQGNGTSRTGRQTSSQCRRPVLGRGGLGAGPDGVTRRGEVTT